MDGLMPEWPGSRHVCMSCRTSAACTMNGDIYLSLPIARGEWLSDWGRSAFAVVLEIEYRTPHHGESEVR